MCRQEAVSIRAYGRWEASQNLSIEYRGRQEASQRLSRVRRPQTDGAQAGGLEPDDFMLENYIKKKKKEKKKAGGLTLEGSVRCHGIM